MAETKFDSLPREMVGEILDHVDTAERQKFRPVSKFWNKNIISLYGATLRVHNANLVSNLSSPACPIKVDFQNLTLPIPIDETGIDFMNCLTSLTFTGMVVCYNICPILEHCIYVRKLELIKFNPNLRMEKHEVKMDDTSKLLPALRALTLKFDYRPFSVSDYTFLSSLLPFFTSENGKLDSIVLDCPDVGGPLGVSFDKMFEKNSFQPLQADHTDRTMELDRSIADDFYNDLLKSNRQTLQNLELADGIYGSRISIKVYRKIDAGCSEIQFSEFEQTMYSNLKRRNFSNSANSITLFDLLEPQIHLTKLSVALSSTFKLEQVYLITANNSNILKCLTIFYSRSFNEYQRMDASRLSKLNVLKVLKYLDVSSEMEIFHMQNRGGRIFNIHSLPKSLRVFISSACLEFQQEADFNNTVFERLQNLETFELTAAPFFRFNQESMLDVCRMDSMKLRQLIAWLPSLKKLVLRNSRPLFETGEGRVVELDALPNTATDWINDETLIGVRKIPIDFGYPQVYANPGIIREHIEWDWGQRYYQGEDQFPVRFDAIIMVDSGFRQRSTLLD